MDEHRHRYVRRAARYKGQKLGATAITIVKICRECHAIQHPAHLRRDHELPDDSYDITVMSIEPLGEPIRARVMFGTMPRRVLTVLKDLGWI